MNAKTIKTQLKNAGLNTEDYIIEKAYNGYNVTYRHFGLSDTERQSMTGEQVNAKRQADKEAVEKIAQVLGGEAGRSSALVGANLIKKNDWVY